jgi:2-keto-4-pentenoate hydratase/2-oxohepta-3-ene-1,7-dioic acid hydratase in catechol pathway
MRIARFSHNDVPQYAFVQQDESDGRDYLVALDGFPFGAQPVKPTGDRYELDGEGIRLLSPVIPSKVYGLAKNYEAHAEFMHEHGHSDIAHAPEDMVIFMKPSTSVIGPDDPIVIPAYSHDMNFEPEVAVVIGRIAKNVPVEHAMEYVLGFTCVNDVTLRDLQGPRPDVDARQGLRHRLPARAVDRNRAELEGHEDLLLAQRRGRIEGQRHHGGADSRHPRADCRHFQLRDAAAGRRHHDRNP